MNLYVDDNLASHLLIVLLRAAGHTVVQPADVGLAGASDARHLTYAIGQTLITLTADYEDFLDLHNLIKAASGSHPGILVVRDETDPSRNMKARDIVRAIRNLERSGVPVADEYIILNHWR